MPNDIPFRQNETELLENKAASSQAYQSGKQLATWQTALAIFAAIAVPVLVKYVPETQFWGAIYCILAILLNEVLEQLIKERQKLGAKLQEVFDTEVYSLPWNQARVGNVPDRETIIELANKYQKSTKGNLDSLKDWYPVDVGRIPIEYARFICQRSNMRWDSALRHKMCAIYVAGIFLLIAGVLCGGVALNWETNKFLSSVVLAVLPAGIKLYREMIKQRESAKASEEAKLHLETTWKKALAQATPPAELEHDARRLQDELFDRRKQSPSVPEFLYKWCRASFETQMKAGATKMIKEVEVKINSQSIV